MSDTRTRVEKSLELQYTQSQLDGHKFLLEMALHPSTRCVSHFSDSLDDLLELVHTQLKSHEASPMRLYKLGKPPTIMMDCMQIRDTIAEIYGTYYKV